MYSLFGLVLKDKSSTSFHIDKNKKTQSTSCLGNFFWRASIAWRSYLYVFLFCHLYIFVNFFQFSKTLSNLIRLYLSKSSDFWLRGRVLLGDRRFQSCFFKRLNQCRCVCVCTLYNVNHFTYVTWTWPQCLKIAKKCLLEFNFCNLEFIIFWWTESHK